MRLIRQYQFQSTLPQGERLLTTQEHFIEDVFQSTLPQGERPCSALKCNLQHNFNPRSHKGSDGYGHKRIIRVEQFQSTLPQGERQQYLTKKSFYPVKYYKNIQIRSKNLSLFHLFKTNSNFFVHYFWCESSGRFMCTIHSHQPPS